MILVVTEKNDAAQQIARLLSESGKPEADKVYNTPVYRFRRGGEDHVAIGLRGHILQPDFPLALKFDKEEAWYGETAEGEHLPADVPDGLERLLTRLSASLLWQTALTLRDGKSPACLI